MLDAAKAMHGFGKETEYVDYLNNLPGFLDIVYDMVFGFYDGKFQGTRIKQMNFQQIEMDIDSDASGRKVKLTFNTIQKSINPGDDKEKLVLRAGGNSFPLAIKLKRLPG
jgi:hypothetical protein